MNRHLGNRRFEKGYGRSGTQRLLKVGALLIRQAARTAAAMATTCRVEVVRRDGMQICLARARALGIRAGRDGEPAGLLEQTQA